MYQKILISCTLFAVLSSIHDSMFVNAKAEGYVGCYADSKKRDLSLFMNKVDSIQKCVEKCTTENMPYAGIQFGHECWCGKTYGVYGLSINCKLPCKNDDDDICGGPWANSVYKTSIDSAQPTGYLGCYADTKKRDLPVWEKHVKSIKECINKCTSKNMPYAGLQWYSECWCGKSYGRYGIDRNCNTPCKTGGTMCGGNHANSVYKTSVPVGSIKPEVYLGCYGDNAKLRDLGEKQKNVDSIQNCIHECSEKEFPLAGLQNGVECWCGESFGRYGLKTDCNVPCKEGGGMCGGRLSNSVFRTTSESVQPTGYVGCYADSKKRDLSLFMNKVDSIQKCIEKCTTENMPYAGIQNGGECWCGKTYGRYGINRNCDKKCSKGGAVCGGHMVNSVYKTPIESAQPTGYLGCYADNKKRDLPVWEKHVKSIKECINKCTSKNMPYAGLQWYSECWCGKSYGRYGIDRNCNTPCKTGGTMCGGNLANSVYKTSVPL